MLALLFDGARLSPIVVRSVDVFATLVAAAILRSPLGVSFHHDDLAQIGEALDHVIRSE